MVDTHNAKDYSDILRLLSNDSDDSDGFTLLDHEDPDADDSKSILTIKEHHTSEPQSSPSSPTSSDSSSSSSPSSPSRRRFSTISDGASRLSRATYSTWSTNMTMSNLVGAGRTLGNLYSLAGRRLEKGVLQLVASRAGRGPDACADRLLALCQTFFAGWPFRALPTASSWKSGKIRALGARNEEAKRDALLIEAMGPDCERLLRYGAATSLPDIQLAAFRRIIDLVTRNPFMRRAFKACCENRNALIDLDAIMFSWKKKIESDNDDEGQYSEEWLFNHRLAIMCLEKNELTTVVDELAYLSWSKDRSEKLAALIKLCQAKDDIGVLSKRFLRGYILDYDAPRQVKPIGLFIRFWEDMLELDQSAHDHLVNIFEAKDAASNSDDAFEVLDQSDDGDDVELLASALLQSFRKDIQYHIRYSHEKGDLRAFLTVWRIVDAECDRFGEISYQDASKDWKTWLALHLEALQIRFDVPPYDHIVKVAPSYAIPV